MNKLAHIFTPVPVNRNNKISPINREYRKNLVYFIARSCV